MTSFDDLYTLAAANRGGAEILESALPTPRTAKELMAQTDDRYLSMMARCVFRAGFVWRVIDNKWPGFEAAFAQFNPLAVGHFSDEKLEELAQDKSIVRNFTKIVSVRHNAVYVLDRKRSHGSFGQFICNALVHHGLMKKFSPNSQRDLKLVEQVFENLRQESGRPLCQISRILACTV